MTAKAIGKWMLTPEGIEKGYLRMDGASVTEVCWGDSPADSVKGLVLPAFVNAHTHIGDTVAYPAPKGSVKEIVGPPDGYKHRVLRSKSPQEKSAAMRSAVDIMAASGTAMFGDFREEGIEGLRLFKNAVRGGWPRPVVFGRPTGTEYTSQEIDSLLGSCDGLGLSAISDWPVDVLDKMSRQAKSAGKMFAIHASESSREDIDSVLSLKPDFLVHMCKASRGDLVACAEDGVPIVVCPSSNRFFGLDPDIPRLLDAGVTVALGTDNGMVARPDILEELKAAFAMSSKKVRVPPMDIVRLAVFGGRKVLNADAKITTEISQKSDLVVIRLAGEDLLGDLVTRARSEDIVATIQGGKVRRTSGWTR